MSYDPLLPAEFKTFKSQFDAVDDTRVQLYIDQALLVVDHSWPENIYKLALIAFTCHLMTLDGLGSDAASQSFASGYSEFQTIRSSEVTLTRFRDGSKYPTYARWLNSTPCGEQFLMWLRHAKSGPRVVLSGVGSPVSGFAKDHPFWGW